MLAPTTVTVLMNAHSRGALGGAQAPLIEALLGRAGVDARVEVLGDPRLLTARARAAVEGGSGVMVVAAGGDGTVSAVVNGIAGTGAVLGVIPLGTLNHFAKDARIPLDAAGAVAALVRGQVVACDLGEVNGRLFVNNSSLGLYPGMVRRRQKQQRQGRNRWVAMLLAALTVLRHYSLVNVSLVADGRAFERRTPLVFIGNNRYRMSGFNMGARKSIEGGRLSLHVPHDLGPLELAGIGVRALAGRLRGVANMDTLEAAEILVETRRHRIAVALDGEVGYLRPPLRYRSLPGALRVVVPRRES